MKYLIAFGCSLTYGDELLDPELVGKEACCAVQNDDYRNSHSYPGILAKHYGLELINTAFPGNSLETERYTLDWLLNYSDIDISECMLVVGHTYPWRQSWFDANKNEDPIPWNNHVHGAWLRDSDTENNWNKLQELWIKQSLCDKWEEYNLRQAFIAFDYVSVKCSIPVVQFSAVSEQVTIPELPDFTLQDIVGKNVKTHGHPDEKGHQLFANHLIDYIDSAIIAE